jgi:hypothetical protein
LVASQLLDRGVGVGGGGCHAGGCLVGRVGRDWAGLDRADTVGSAFLLDGSSAQVGRPRLGRGAQGHKLSSRPRTRPRAGPVRLLLHRGAGDRAVAAPPRQAALRLGPAVGVWRRAGAQRDRIRIGWQVLLMLAREAGRSPDD